MKKMKKLLCLLLALAMLFALTACGGKSDGGNSDGKADGGSQENKFNPGPKGDEKITLRIGTTGYLGRFLSGLAPEESHSACNAVFDSIFRVDPWTKQIKSDVLDDWYWEDEHHFIMKLHDGVYFSNGQKATSEDLLFSYQNHEERGSNYLSGMYLDLDKYPDTKPYFALSLRGKDINEPGHYFNHPFYLVLNLSVGDFFPNMPAAEKYPVLIPSDDPSFQRVTALPADGTPVKMYVDYIRVYKK